MPSHDKSQIARSERVTRPAIRRVARHTPITKSPLPLVDRCNGETTEAPRTCKVRKARTDGTYHIKPDPGVLIDYIGPGPSTEKTIPKQLERQIRNLASPSVKVRAKAVLEITSVPFGTDTARDILSMLPEGNNPYANKVRTHCINILRNGS